MNCTLYGCSVCLTGYFLDTFGNCSTNCPDGYYVGWDCPTCPMSCLICLTLHCTVCSNSTSCQACDTGYFLYNGNCSSLCPTGTYANSGVCTDCAVVGWAQCNNTNCINCLDQFINVYLNGPLTITSCDITCPSSNYLINNRNCTACPSQCSICINSTNCSACQPGYMFWNYQCYQTCPAGTYVVTGAIQCVVCPTGCTACTETQCTSCA
jgi:proprotein convertase subtilisin/kexin type 5